MHWKKPGELCNLKFSSVTGNSSYPTLQRLNFLVVIFSQYFCMHSIVISCIIYYHAKLMTSVFLVDYSWYWWVLVCSFYANCSVTSCNNDRSTTFKTDCFPKTMKQDYFFEDTSFNWSYDVCMHVIVVLI